MRTYASLVRGLGVLTWCATALACEGPDHEPGNDAPAAAQQASIDGGVASGPSDTRPQNPVKPYVSAAGIGVTDLSVSTKFYADVFELKSLYTLDTPYWKETVLQDVRGNHVVTMDFVRERNTKKNPVKLVFAVKSANDWYQKVLAAGGSETTPPSKPQNFQGATIGMVYDPDGYLLELYEAATVPAPVLVAVGIGVNSLDASADYYTRVLGLKFARDIPVPGFMNEKELQSNLSRGPSVVLMDYEDPTRVVTDIPAKIVLAVPDAKGFADFIKAEDPSKLITPPAPYENSGLIVGMARDLEGYLVEIVQQAATDGGVAADAGN